MIDTSKLEEFRELHPEMVKYQKVSRVFVAALLIATFTLFFAFFSWAIPIALNPELDRYIPVTDQERFDAAVEKLRKMMHKDTRR